MFRAVPSLYARHPTRFHQAHTSILYAFLHKETSSVFNVVEVSTLPVTLFRYLLRSPILTKVRHRSYGTPTQFRYTQRLFRRLMGRFGLVISIGTRHLGHPLTNLFSHLLLFLFQRGIRHPFSRPARLYHYIGPITTTSFFYSYLYGLLAMQLI